MNALDVLLGIEVDENMNVSQYVDRIFKDKQYLAIEEYSLFDDMDIISILSTVNVMKDALNARHHCLVCLNPSNEKSKNLYIIYMSLVVLDACFCSEECLSLYCLQKGKTVLKFEDINARQKDYA